MRAGQVAGLTPDRTDFGGLTSIKALAFVQNGTAHRLFFHIMIVTVDEGCLFFQFFFGELCLEFFADGIESIHAFVLVLVSGSGDGISLVVASVVNGFTKFFVVHFVAIFAFHGRAYFFCQFHLCLALNLNGFVCGLHRFQQVLLGNLVHFAFHHHDVFISGAHHQIHIGLLQLLKGRVDDKLSVDACYAYFGNRSVEGDI